MKRRGLFISLMIFSLASFILGTTVYYFLLTRQGSRIMAKFILNRVTEKQETVIDAIDGTWRNGMSFKNIELKNLKGFPEGSTFRLQRLNIVMRSLNLTNAALEIENARLILPDSEPIVFDGSYKAANLDFVAYSGSFDIKEIISLFPPDKAMSSLRGTVTDLDLNIKGPLTGPTAQGEFFVSRIYNKDFMLVNSSGTFFLKPQATGGDRIIYGDIRLKDGSLEARNTKIKILEGRLSFSGDNENPALFLSGTSSIDSVKIKINLRGTMKQPDLQLTSDPPKSQDMLLLMLVTGKGWKGLETSINQGQLSPDLTKDFIDYLVFAGTGEQIAQKLGIKDIRLKVEKDKKGIGVKKTISGNLDVDYEIQESGQQNQPKQIDQKIGGDLKITETISVSAEKEIKAQLPNQLKTEQVAPPDDKIFLKYKKDF